MFSEVIRQYPTSTKTALAAFYIGQIYEDVGEYQRAVEWYRRSYHYDPYIAKPARYQAAVVADQSLQNHGMALEFYREAVEKETSFTDNLSRAQKRIYELTTDPQGGVMQK